jgi:hypothetical protein
MIPHGMGDLYAAQFVVSVFIRFRVLARTQAEFFIMASVIEFTKLRKKFQPHGIGGSNSNFGRIVTF